MKKMVKMLQGGRTAAPARTRAEKRARGRQRRRRVLTKRTAAALQALLAGVVAGGTGHEAALPGQTAAGKTGTAQTGPFSGGTSHTCICMQSL